MADLTDSLIELNLVRRLTDQGRFTEVLERLEGLDPGALSRSPTLALFCGIAHGRLGRFADSTRWVDRALTGADQRRDLALHARALNVRGAIALESGRIDEAEDFFMRALAEAKSEGDDATVGRCSNNLGIIANLRGRRRSAVSWYTLALAAFQRAGMPQGLAETENDLRITYRDLGQLDRALEAADRAVEIAAGTGNLPLLAFAMAGRAEIRVLAGEPEVAEREMQRVGAIRRKAGDEVAEAEDLRVRAMIAAALGRTAEAEASYREAIARAEQHSRPLLAAAAGRRLAELLAAQGRVQEAAEAARTARAQFSLLGAKADVHRLDALLENLA